MGLTTSRELEEALHQAHLKAEREEVVGVGDILFNDAKFIERLATTWKSIPPTSRAKISGRPRGRNRVRKAVSKSTSKITLSDSLKQYLAFGKAAPSTLIERNEVFQFDPQSNGFAQVYKLQCDLDKSHTSSRIQRRFLLLVISRFKKKLCTRLHGDAEQHIALTICQSGLVKENGDSILKNLTRWASAGTKLDQLATDLGGLGSLMLLPGDICDTTWEVKLPMTGPIHEQTIASLKKRGICNAGSMRWDIDSHTQTSVNEIADGFFHYLWKLVDQPVWTEIQTLSSERSDNLGLLIAAVNAESNEGNDPQSGNSGFDPAKNHRNEPLALVHGCLRDDRERSLARTTSQALCHSSSYDRITVLGPERSGQSCFDGMQANSVQGTMEQVGDSCITNPSQLIEHDSSNLSALYNFGLSASLPLQDASATFNPSRYAEPGIDSMAFDPSRNAQEHSYGLFNPSNHVQLGDSPFYDTTLQEQMRNTCRFDPSSYTQVRIENTTTILDPSNHMGQENLSIPPEDLLDFPPVHAPA